MTSSISCHFKAGNLAKAETWQPSGEQGGGGERPGPIDGAVAANSTVVLIAAGTPGGEHAPILSTRFM